MNEIIRAPHLVERAAARLRGDLGLSGAASPPSREAAPAALDTAEPVAPQSSAPPDAPAALPAQPAVAPFAPDLPPPEPLSSPTEPPAGIAMATLERVGVALGSNRRTRLAEEFSVTAGTLLRALRAVQAGGPGVLPAGAFSNLLLVTSAKPGEGKSFSAANLAATLAHKGLARVVLADLDPKSGSISTQLGLDGRPGLFDLAADSRLRPDAVLVGTAVRDLSVLPLGRSDRDAVAHGLTREMASAIERVARRFAGQVVVLDAPPCLATSEPSALASLVGMVAMVVEAERTQREELEHALDLVRACPNVMLLLNKTRGTRGHAFGDYDYYGA